ncbi:MAG: hypothetical protein ACOX8I_09340 [Bacillota bacterium]|jgi:hypothetical protein
MIDRREIYEARSAAYDVLSLLREVERQLKSARNWGIYDMLGGGMFSTLIKHGKVDKAETLLRQVRDKLIILQRELGDVRVNFATEFRLTGFERFMDFAFDNILTDWLVQSKIQNTLREVNDLMTEVQRVINVLDRIERQNSTVN